LILSNKLNNLEILSQIWTKNCLNKNE